MEPKARKGDDTNAFGHKFLLVKLKDAEKYNITKAEVRIGSIIKTFDNPTFPFWIELNREESMKLAECGNVCKMAVYDQDGLKETCKGGTCFNASPKEV